MLPEKSRKSLSIAALVLSSSALVLLLLGYLSPQWISAQSARQDELRFGLWRACYKDSKQGGNTVCSLSNQFMYQGWNEEWLPGVQCMLTFAMLSAVLCVICTWCYKFVPSLSQQPGPVFIALNTSFTTGVLSFLSVLVLGVQQANDDVNFDNTTLHWGFAVTVLSLALIIATCVILLLEFYELLFMKSEFKERMSLHRRQLVEILDSELIAKSSENTEELGLYQDSTENAAFEFPSAIGIDNQAYITEGRQRRRSRHVYDNNVKTRDGFRIYDNAATLQPEIAKRSIDEEDEIELKSVSQQASVRSRPIPNEDEKSYVSDDVFLGTTTADIQNGDSTDGDKASMTSGALSEARCRESIASGSQKDVPLHLFQASKKSDSSSRKSVKSAKSVNSTAASMKPQQENIDSSSTAPSKTGKGNDSDMEDRSSDLEKEPDTTEKTNTEDKCSTPATLRRTTRKSRKEGNLDEVSIKADIHEISTDQNQSSETGLPDDIRLSTSPISMIENDLYK